MGPSSCRGRLQRAVRGFHQGSRDRHSARPPGPRRGVRGDRVLPLLGAGRLHHRHSHQRGRRQLARRLTRQPSGPAVRQGSPMAPKIIPVSPFDCVVFGATGDLTLRKLLPALYHRFRDGQMPPESRVFGAARSKLSDEAFRDRARQALDKHVAADALEQDNVNAFCERLHYVSIDAGKPGSDWSALQSTLDPERVRVFYLATSPNLYGPICRNLKSADLVTERARVVLEKPIGHDLKSARAINDEVGE